MICCIGTGGGDALICEDASCSEGCDFAGSAGRPEGTTVPGGGGGKGPCRCAARGGASAIPPIRRNATNPDLAPDFLTIPEITRLMLFKLLTMTRSFYSTLRFDAWNTSFVAHTQGDSEEFS